MVRWGIISTARIAERIVDGARIAPNAELVAVGSRDEARGREYAERFGIPRVHGSYEALLADPEVDAVYNPLPNSLHVPWSIRALEAGKHVLCEKPLSRRPEDVEAAFDAAERAGRVLTEAFMWRFHPQTEALARLARDGTIGELRYARAQFGFNQPDLTDVRWLAELEGGALMDVGCYCLSALRLVCGAEPERVSAELVEGGNGVDGRLAAVLRFPGDVLGTFDCGMDVHGRMGIEVVGSEGALHVPDPWFGAEPLILVTRGDGDVERVEAEPVHPYARELEEVSAAIVGGPPPRLGRADALAQARGIAALYRAAAEGRAITV
jgi:predicted dehydrogenase